MTTKEQEQELIKQLLNLIELAPTDGCKKLSVKVKQGLDIIKALKKIYLVEGILEIQSLCETCVEQIDDLDKLVLIHESNIDGG